MNDLIYLSEALEYMQFSRDLREYVVPVRCLKHLQTENSNNLKVSYDKEATDEKLKVLFNRCLVYTSGALCVWCGMKDECCVKRSVNKETQ